MGNTQNGENEGESDESAGDDDGDAAIEMR